MRSRVKKCAALAAAAFLQLMLPAAKAAGRLPTYQLQIDSQPLKDALKTFAQQSGLQLVFYTDVAANHQAPALNGRLTTDEALKALLGGTPLVYRRLNETTIEVTVSGSATTGNRLGNTASNAEVMNTRLAQYGQTPSQERLENSPAASDTERRIEEIIVTAQKRAERLQDVPVPVTVISAESLVASNQLRLQDYYTKIPGLSLALYGGGGTPVIALRGITTGGIANPTVGVVIDDISYGATVTPSAVPAVPDIDPFDLARVEVLRGPQGTLYGASSIGGLLKFVTVDPSTDAVSGRVQAGLSSIHGGRNLGYNFRGAVNVPLSETLAVRANGFMTRDPGYVDNSQSGERDVNRRDGEGGRLSALWRPSENFSLKLSVLFQDSDRLGTEEVDVSLGLRGLRQSALRGTGLYSRDSQAYNATMTAKLGAVDFTSVTGYSVDEIDTIQDAPFFSVFAPSSLGVVGVAVPLPRRIEKFSQEIRASLPVGQRINWLFGAFYTGEDNLSHVDWQAANPFTGAVVGTLFTNDVPSTYDEYAAFTNITVDISDRLDVQFGGRIGENRQSLSSARSGVVSEIFFGGSPSILSEKRFQDTSFTYLVTPRFKVSPDFMVYARLASGYRPGGPNLSCGVGGIPCGYGPDTTRNYEVGIKGDLPAQALSFDASLYYIDWRDLQLSLVAANLGYNDNASRAKSQGVELSVAAKPRTGLTIAAWIGWNGAELTEAFPPTSVSAFGRSGDRLPYSSRFSGSFSADQELPLGGSAIGFLGGSVSYVGDRKGIFQPTAVRETFPAYTQVDLRAGVKYGTWTLNAFINNAADKRGILRGGLDSFNGSPTVFSYIDPRTFGMALSKDF